MQEDFHYHATYCAAYLAGFSHNESQVIGYSSNFVDLCTRTLISKLGGPSSAASTQLNLEMADGKGGVVGNQDITRIWASFHFLPYDLHATLPKCSKRYLDKYRLICKPNGDLVVDTIKLAQDSSLQAIGVAMHVLADTWAHAYHAGTPSLVINNSSSFYELIEEDDRERAKKIRFVHRLGGTDDVNAGNYTASIYHPEEDSIMNLGHGRAGHLPDYSFIKYAYLPAWANYKEIVKDNPSDYYHAFCQMVYALKFLRGSFSTFEKGTYDEEAVAPYKEQIMEIIKKRQVIACEDWKAFGESLSGQSIEDFDPTRYQQEYMDATNKEESFLGKFFLATMSQKSMVTNKIFKSGNRLAGFSVDFAEKGFRGIKDFRVLVDSLASMKAEQ